MGLPTNERDQHLEAKRDELRITCAACGGEIPSKRIAVVWIADGEIKTGHVECPTVRKAPVEAAAPAPASDQQPTYQVGDFVWANASLQSGGLAWLARVESAHSIRAFNGVRWYVRVRKASGWTSDARHLYVQRKLPLAEYAEACTKGLIPPAGARL